MIDTHCHVHFEDYDEDRTEVLNRAQDKLSAIVVSGTSLETNEDVLDLSKNYEGFIYPSLGFHPVTSQNSTDEELTTVQNQIIDNLNDLVAIGEVGMDFFYCKDKALRNRQREIFLSFVEIANDYQVPLLIHGRDCEKKIYNIVKDYEDIPKVVFHCYGGSLKTAKKLLDMDDYFMSFSTMICYSERHEELVKNIPLERMLTETDSPYLAMTKEERNEPANVCLAAQKIAEIKNVDLATVDEITERNANYVFGI